MVRKAEKLSQRSARRAQDLFSVPWDQIDRSVVSAVPVNELKEEVREYQRLLQQRIVVERNGPGDDAPGRYRLVGPGIAVLVGGLLALPSVGVDAPVALNDAVALALGLVGLAGVIGGCLLGVRWLVRVARAKRSSWPWIKSVRRDPWE